MPKIPETEKTQRITRLVYTDEIYIYMIKTKDIY